LIQLLPRCNLRRFSMRNGNATGRTSNLRAVNGMGNVLLPARLTGLPKDSVANASQVVTLDKTFLMECVGMLPDGLQEEVDNGLRSVLYL
jgi:mRNA interferase MazF